MVKPRDCSSPLPGIQFEWNPSILLLQCAPYFPAKEDDAHR